LKPDETEIRAMQDKMTSLRSKLEKDKDILGDSELRKKVKDLEAKSLVEAENL